MTLRPRLAQQHDTRVSSYNSPSLSLSLDSGGMQVTLSLRFAPYHSVSVSKLLLHVAKKRNSSYSYYRQYNNGASSSVHRRSILEFAQTFLALE